MTDVQAYDVVIVGGGLAGLSLAILMARAQYRVLLLEKETYPKHKVCGEYISMESKPFLQSLGVPIDQLRLPVINKLHLTDTRGNELKAALPQGGFGISRYMLDDKLAALAAAAGATVLTKTRAENITWTGDGFTIETKTQTYTAKVVSGTWGKRGNIDVKWKRPFITARSSGLNNYVGIKYHIRYDWPEDYIGLHNFTDGYTGISRIEDGKCCMCYLTTAASLQANGGDIKQMEQAVLMKNPWLHDIYSRAEFLYDAPVAISQISFGHKEQALHHVLMAGDTAGLITPLCGNGMSMAMHAAKLQSGYIHSYLQGRITRSQMEQQYTAAWKKNFSSRIAMGRFVQGNFGRDNVTALFIKAVKALPFLQKPLINGTSGRVF